MAASVSKISQWQQWKHLRRILSAPSSGDRFIRAPDVVVAAFNGSDGCVPAHKLDGVFFRLCKLHGSDSPEVPAEIMGLTAAAYNEIFAAFTDLEWDGCSSFTELGRIVAGAAVAAGLAGLFELRRTHLQHARVTVAVNPTFAALRRATVNEALTSAQCLFGGVDPAADDIPTVTVSMLVDSEGSCAPMADLRLTLGPYNTAQARGLRFKRAVSALTNAAKTHSPILSTTSPLRDIAAGLGPWFVDSTIDPRLHDIALIDRLYVREIGDRCLSPEDLLKKRMDSFLPQVPAIHNVVGSGRGALAGIKTLTSAPKGGSIETPDDLLLLNAAVGRVAGILKITTPPLNVDQAQARIIAVVDFLQEQERAKTAIARGPSSAAGSSSSGGHHSAAHAVAQLSFGSS